MEENKNFEKENEQVQNFENNQEPQKIKEESGVGPVIGSIIVIILIILGGIYYWNSIKDRVPVETNQNTQAEQNADEDLSEIEAEIDLSELDQIDQDVSEIEAEIENEQNQ